jgi:cellulase
MLYSLFSYHILSHTDSIDQLTITGTGTATPALVNFPGAYSPSDPGILVNIYQKLATYVAPGPTIYSGGTTKSAGAACMGVESSKGVGPPVTQTNSASAPTGTSGSTAPVGCSVPKFQQCGGLGYTGCTFCDVSSFISSDLWLEFY